MIQGTLDVVNVEDIDYGERGRKDYKDIASLASSIRERGLIHPIAIMPHAENAGKYLLLAGGRRLRAHQHLKLEKIECKIFPSGLSDLEITTIELSENIHREDLDFHEKAALSKKIRDTLVQMYGKKTSTAPDAPGVSDRDVAKLIGVSPMKLSQDLSLADTMEKFPDVPWTQCKNRAEALKIKENIGKVFIRHEAAKNFEKVMNDNPKNLSAKDMMKKKLSSLYIVGDFFEKVQNIPDNSMNIVEIDPPYAIELDKVKKRTGFGNYSYSEAGYNEINQDDYQHFIFRTFLECYRVMAQDSWLICWFSPDPWYPIILDGLRTAGFIVRGLPCVWAKGEADETGLVESTTGQTNSPIRHLASSVEYFFYAKKGDPRINKMGRTNCFGFKPVSPTKKIHPTERPVDLITEILTTFAIEGSRVLVPFAGSGNTLVAAFQNKMIPVGYDLGEIYKEAFLARLETVL